jgi:hypothetical protein
MRRFSIVFLIACGGGSSGNANKPVVELTAAEQEELCERFLDDICMHPDAESFCDDPCIASGCAAAVANGHVTGQCTAPITAGMVEECAESFSMSVCLEGGGCMFDALEAACP